MIIETGWPSPAGATCRDGGVNFSVFSKNAKGLQLLLFDSPAAPEPSRILSFDPLKNRTYHHWHAFVPGLKAGQIYAYRALGPYVPHEGLRFDSEKVLLDPYGLGIVVPPSYNREAACQPGDNAAKAMRSVVVDARGYDWEGDTPLHRPFSHTVIYEMHVAGFTRHPNSGLSPDKRGTYAGLIEKIPYLRHLGITAVELLPVFAFDPHDCPQGSLNYWGYAPVSFFAPHPGYSSRKDPLGPLDEFRDMVKALHRAGIEVILDVVYNHTAEGDHRGPTLCFKGLDNDGYYSLDEDRSRYSNYSGCGNSLNAGQAVVRRLIRESLKYWVTVMHVDGFRFDLASILGRDEKGRPMENPPVIWDIETDPVLAGTKLIAEAWDAAGLYQVGTFVGDFWMEWNGKFRDDIRRFVKGDSNTVSHLAQRMVGSPDVFAHDGREVEQSINFVTCHDGFTLEDLVSYNYKHNEANGEDNRDGTSDNHSWNCGFEGPTQDPRVDALRLRQIKNCFALNLLALGTPMVLMGDEVRRSQGGNNNGYCLDNPAGWFDWSLIERHGDLHRFVRELIRRRVGRRMDVPHGLSLLQLLQKARIQWHGTRLHQPDWAEWSHSLAYSMEYPGVAISFFVIANAHHEPLDFELPPVRWKRWIDTGLDSPHDIQRWDDRPTVPNFHYRAREYSVVVLVRP